MLRIDPDSVVAMTCVLGLILTLLHALIWRDNPAQRSGMGCWIGALVAWVATAFAILLRDRMPPLAAHLALNISVVGGVILHEAGTRMFLGQQVRPQRDLTLVVALALAMMALPDSYRGRVLVVGSVLTWLYLRYFLLLRRHGSGRLPERFLLGSLLVGTVAIVWRLAMALLDRVGSQLVESTPAHTLYLASFAFTMLTLALGSILLAHEGVRLELERLATRDPLTDALNRRAMMAALANECERAERTGRGFALLLLDIDHFKRLNDEHGHAHGDAVLVHLVRQVQSQLRRIDSLSRHGGEEFLVLLPEASEAAAAVVGQRIHDALRTGHPLDCRVSIGLACWARGEDADALLARADAALYGAKDDGRNQTRVAAAAPQGPVVAAIS